MDPHLGPPPEVGSLEEESEEEAEEEEKEDYLYTIMCIQLFVYKGYLRGGAV
jgi:hypothetical protein